MSDINDPLRMGRVLHLAMEEIVGGEELRALLQAAGADGSVPGDEFVEAGIFSGARLAGVLTMMEQRYGEPGGRGAAQRVGRACFQYGLREYGEALGLTTSTFRLLPFPAKVKKFAESIAEMFNRISGDCVHIEEGDGVLRWRMENCPFCRGRHTEQAACPLPVGVAEEALYWLSGGKTFSVVEAACAARGEAACIVQADETPLS